MQWSGGGVPMPRDLPNGYCLLPLRGENPPATADGSDKLLPDGRATAPATVCHRYEVNPISRLRREEEN